MNQFFFVLTTLVICTLSCFRGYAAFPSVCSDPTKVIAAAERAFKSAGEARGDNPQYKMSSAKFDRWEVDIQYGDSCYRTVTVFMKPGTCTQEKAPIKGHETCTDE